MALFRRPSPPPSPEDEFANEVIAVAQSIPGVTATRAAGFALRIARPGGAPTVMNLHNFYLEAQRLSGAARAEHLRRAVLAMMPPPRPATWAEAGPLLLPSVRSVSWSAGPAAHGGPAGASVSAPFGRPLVPFVKVLCAIDSELSMSFATAADLAAWGVSDDQALRTATANLIGQGCQVRRNGPVTEVLGPDGYVSSWLAVPAVLGRIAGDPGGDVIAVAPTRAQLTLIDAGQTEAVTRLLEQAFDRYQNDARPLSPVPYLVTEAGIEPWTPPPGHPAAVIADRCVRYLAAVEYRQQKSVLDETLPAAGDGACVGKHALLQGKAA